MSESRGEQRRTKSTINKCHNQNTSTGVGPRSGKNRPSRTEVWGTVARDDKKGDWLLRTKFNGSFESSAPALAVPLLTHSLTLSLFYLLSLVLFLSLSPILEPPRPYLWAGHSAASPCALSHNPTLPPPIPRYPPFRYPLILEMDSEHSETNFWTRFVFLIVFLTLCSSSKLVLSQQCRMDPPPPQQGRRGFETGLG